MFRSLRTRYYIVTVGIAIIPILILGLTAGWRSSDELERQSLALQTELATRVEQQIATFLTSRINELRVLERTNLLASIDAGQLRASIARLLAHDQVYQEILVLNPEGGIEAFVSRTQAETRDGGPATAMPDIPPDYWRDADFYVGSIEFDGGLREPLVEVAIPVLERQTGRVAKVLLAHIRIKSTWGLLAEINLPDDAEAFVTDTEGRILAHSSPAAVLSESRFALPAQSGRHTLADGSIALVATRPLTYVSDPAFIVVTRPLSAALANANDLRRGTLISAVLLLLIGSVLALWQSRSIVRPVERLANHARQISAGDLDTPIDVAEPEEIAALGQALQEMTARLRQTISDLERSEYAERQRAMVTLQSIGDAVITTDPDGTVTYINAVAERLTGWPLAEAVGQPLSTVFDILNETTREPAPNPVERCLQTGGIVALANNSLLLSRDGAEYAISDSAAPIQEEGGDVLGVVMVFQDVTESREMERRLRQSQKLEAIGQLSGGIAHDFNNLMQVIQGNAELLAEDPNLDPDLTRPIIRATQRGANLTQRLLAYARKQPLVTRSTDLRDLLEGLVPMLDRTLGETIRVSLEIADGVWPVEIDPGQLETALLNLALNAQDAMPGGGDLWIRCENFARAQTQIDNDDVPEGMDFVLLSVSDTGTGMTEDTRKRAVDPFFTTKEVGAGSGLGLSMVYGFVKQIGGNMTIDSAEGAGTTVLLYLPRSKTEAETDLGVQGPAAVASGSETILVVEDDPAVRLFVKKLLTSLGYRFVEAETVAGARVALADAQQIDLVLCDVVLPGGTSGLDLARDLGKTRPDLPVVLMSGYPDATVGGANAESLPNVLLTKPFQRAQLADAITQGLNKRPAKS